VKLPIPGRRQRDADLDDEINAHLELAIADRIMGDTWANARHFRFGASSLLASLLTTLGHATAKSNGGY